MDDPLAEAWLVNNRATQLLLANLDEADLATTLSTRGGRSVGQQFVHVCDVRLARLEAADKRLLKGLPRITREQGHDQAKLIHALTLSANAVAQLIRESAAAGGEVKGFKRGLATLVGYLIAHEAHHRGHALLTLKQRGVRLDDSVRFGIWDWNKL
jgi:uncharacterized damage-inducible protein DinB